MDNFDTERFIIEIQSRPSIWDNFSPDYSTRDLKKKCWEEVVDLFGEQEQTVEQKQSLGKYTTYVFINEYNYFAMEVGFRLQNNV